ncbi:cytochrome c biogenesis protein CcsA [Paenibacillus sp. GSMTC-2017]|uniref:cytochrome c biogenesis protein CcsA n=1 Tax=Paenibacillus sp. GSMTC-2017 TaxID=2794350 RepID=UPI0018D9DD90|nr:cytochrome c biogenesis protein CcsA [Paenibacillus sp. GSMTC-2017]MBH5317178.1 cytochrome c biogenesis protein CcsA [Paenibacillus sp. GSMTC-2017]
MGTANWMYDAILYIYALTLLFYFSDFMNASRRAKRIGTGLLIFVWMLQTGYLVMKLISSLDTHNIATFEYWLGFSWLLVTISLVISRFFFIDYIVFFVNVVSFAVLAVNLYSGSSDGDTYALWQMSRELLYVHISLILCAYAALTIGALLAGMYLFLHHRLKVKRWSKFVRRFPSLDTIERYADRAVIIGVPLLAMSLAVAVISLLVEGRPMLLLDWKVLTSFAALVMYIAYVYQRAVKKRPGKQLAKLYIISFSMLLINLLTNSFSSFH